MYNELCHSGTWGSLGNLGVLDGVGLILNLVFWVGLIAALTLLVVWVVRRARVPAAAGQPTAMQVLQARYARDEITREQYETMKQDLG